MIEVHPAKVFSRTVKLLQPVTEMSETQFSKVCTASVTDDGRIISLSDEQPSKVKGSEVTPSSTLISVSAKWQ